MPTSRGPAASPFAVSVRDLARRPGTQRALVQEVAVPEVFGSEVIGVPEGAPLELDLSLESVSEGIWVSGTASATAVGECGRCLDEVRLDVAAPVQGLFRYPDVEWDGDGDQEDVHDFDGDSLDLEGVVRDAVVMELPFTPLCGPDCPGLCAECGARLADEPGHVHDRVDPRWAALESLTDQKES